MSQISASSETAGSVEPTLRRKIQSRKFLVAVGVLVAATVLLVMGFITGEHWVQVAQFVTVGYVVGQAWQDRARPSQNDWGYGDY